MKKKILISFVLFFVLCLKAMANDHYNEKLIKVVIDDQKLTQEIAELKSSVRALQQQNAELREYVMALASENTRIKKTLNKLERRGYQDYNENSNHRSKKGKNRADFDSGWIDIKKAQKGSIVHNLNTQNFSRIQVTMRESETNNDEIIIPLLTHEIYKYEGRDPFFYGLYFYFDKGRGWRNRINWETAKNGITYLVYSGLAKEINWSTHHPSKGQIRMKLWK